jgi:hypothetical protein
MREGLSLLMRRLSRMRSSSGEEQQEKSLREAVWRVLSKWERILDMTGFLLLLPVSGETSKCSDTHGASDGPFGPNIRCGTATTREGIHNTRS